MNLRIVSFVLLGMTTQAIAATIYVDPSREAACADYDKLSRACGSGDAQAVSRFDDAQSRAEPGDVIMLRGGRYPPLDIRISGTRDLPIAVRVYAGETAVVSDPGSVGLRIVQQENLRIEGLTFDNVIGFGRLENARNVHLRSLSFRNAGASGTTGALKFVRSEDNRVEKSSFEGGSDLLLLQDNSNRNLILENAFRTASHSLISIRCSSFNVIRGNEFRNREQKALEIYDCEGVSDAPVRLDDTKRNLIEDNRFLESAAAGVAHYFNAIQHGGQENIVRFNVFANNLGGGVNYQYYSEESLFVYGNRLYNNTFVRNSCYAIIGQDGAPARFRDNRVLNNLLFMNRGCRGERDQSSIRNRRSVIVLKQAEVTADPGFLDLERLDLRLRKDSPLIDAGGFAARAATSGSGRNLLVDDATWFYDGFGIEGETGDRIRIRGSDRFAVVTSIDLNEHLLELDRELTWSDGDGVHVFFSGEAPDIGAFEAGVPGRELAPR